MYYLSYPAEQALTFVSGGQLVKQRDFIHQRRCIDTFVLICVTKGVLHISQHGEKLAVQAGHFVLLHAFTEHYGYQKSEDELQYFWVHFLPPGDAVLSQTPGAAPDCCCLPESGALHDSKRAALLFNQLLDCSRSRLTGSVWLLHYLLSALALEISGEFFSRSQPASGRIPERLAAIQRWIAVNYAQPLRVSALAEQFHYNPDYLSNDFRRHCGCSLTQYINRVRIEAAQSLLVTDTLSMRELAACCGFPDEKYFYRVFRRVTGMTPRAYQNTFYQRKEVYR